MKKSKMVQRKWEKVKNHPFRTWEDTPRFCASDFAVNKEEIKEAIEWCKNTPVIPKDED